MLAAWQWWPDSLLVIGGVMQAGGVLLLVADVRKAVEAAREYQHRPQVVEMSHAIEANVVVPTPTIGGGVKPTVEERVERLEGSLMELDEELADKAAAFNLRMQEVAQEAGDRAYRAAERRFSALERAVLGDTRRDIRRRVVSIALLVGGIVLASVGAVLA